MKDNSEWLFEGRGVTMVEASEYFIKYVCRNPEYQSLEVWDLKTVPLGRISRDDAIMFFTDWKQKNLGNPDIQNSQLVEVKLIAQ